MKNCAQQARFLMVAIGLVAGVAGQAKADILTFDGQPTGPILAGASFTEGAFTITALGNGHPSDTTTIQNVGGTDQNALVDGNPNDRFGTTTEITLTGGGEFSLISLDIANLDNSGSVPPPEGFRIEVQGGKGDHGYEPGSSTFSTESPTDLTNIKGLIVTIVSDSEDTYAVDNIVLIPSSVPEPSALLLLATVLAGVAVGARRRRA
jgi:PEP-CTERM motif